MNIKELNIDYQVKAEELIKETIFLQQYTKQNRQEKAETSIKGKEEDYVR